MHGRRIVSHHQNPDGAACANMPGQWIRGVYPLHDYVAFYVLWVAKALHEHCFGFYPGPQHCLAAVRVQRDRFVTSSVAAEGRRRVFFVEMWLCGEDVTGTDRAAND